MTLKKKRQLFIDTLYDKIDKLIDQGQDLFVFRDMVAYYEKYPTQEMLKILEFTFSKIDILRYCAKLIKHYKEVQYD